MHVVLDLPKQRTTAQAAQHSYTVVQSVRYHMIGTLVIPSKIRQFAMLLGCCYVTCTDAELYIRCGGELFYIHIGFVQTNLLILELLTAKLG